MPDREMDNENEADRREFPVSMDQFPVRAKKFPVRAKKFRVPNRTGNLPQRIGIAERTDGSLGERGAKMAGIRKIP